MAAHAREPIPIGRAGERKELGLRSVAMVTAEETYSAEVRMLRALMVRAWRRHLEEQVGE